MKKILSIALVIVLAISAFSVVAFADTNQATVLGKTFVMNNADTDSNKGTAGSVITETLWTMEDLADEDEITIKFNIKNNGTEKLNIRAGLTAIRHEDEDVDAFNALWNTGQTWTTISALEGGEEREIEWTFGPFDEGVFTDRNDIDWKIEDLILRIQSMDSGKIPEGTSISVWCDDVAEYNRLLKTFTNKNTTTNPWTITDYIPGSGAVPSPSATATNTATATATATPTPMPATGATFTVAEDIESEAAEQYLITSTKGGVISATDVKDGEVTKTFKVVNEGDFDITIVFTCQATVKVNGNDRWEAPAAGEAVTIGAGETAEITYIFEVNDDNTVTIKDEDVTLDKLFYRFNVKGEGGNGFIDGGTKFTVYGIGTDNAAIAAISKTGFTVTPVYTAAPGATGDMLPLALTLTAVAAVAALVVVAKKRKED